MKPISQMTREEKLQEIVEYNPCRVERSAVLRYLLAVRRNDTEQIAYFESFGKSVRHIILNASDKLSDTYRIVESLSAVGFFPSVGSHPSVSHCHSGKFFISEVCFQTKVISLRSLYDSEE